MILEKETFELIGRSYIKCPIRTKVCFSCDYCGIKFLQIKKTAERNRKILGKDSCGSLHCSKQKRSETNLLKFGTKNFFESDSFKEKTKSTNQALYGNDHYLSSEQGQEKRKQGLLRKYGVDSPLQSKQIRKKHEQSCLEKYGVSNPAQSPELLEKRKTTNFTKYGVASPMSLPHIQAKKDKTSQAKFGAPHYTQTIEYKKQFEATCLKKYGVSHSSKFKETRVKSKNTCLKRYGVTNYAKLESAKEAYRISCLAKFGVPNPLCLPENRQYGKSQKELADWLMSLGFEFKSDYAILNGKEIDLYNPANQLAIEYCGLYWHTELSPQPRLRLYHYDKYKICLSKGIRLITIFEDEWKTRMPQCKNFLKSILNVSNFVIYARNCTTKELDKDEFNIFCDVNHIQGHTNTGMFFIGLIHNSEIVGAMSLGRHHRQNQQGLVLDRLCFKEDVKVIGGATKLFSYCLKWAKENNAEKITTWSDNRWSGGLVYPKMGFALDKELPPDYSYVNLSKPLKRISKQSQQKSLTNCPISMTEREWSVKNGLARIWDCGKKRWIIYI